jgi:DNA modification methylase
MSIRCLDSRHGENWSLYHGDCVEVVRQMPACSVDFTVYSPPFADLFIYSESERDMGNCSSDEQFAQHYGHLLTEMFRVMRPGRIAAVHVSDLPARKSKEGFIGMRDFSGDVIRAHTAAGFHYHGRFTIWKDPVREMQRTKSHGLLYKNIKEDSTRNRMGFPDYVLLFKRPPITKQEEEHVKHVSHTPEQFPLDDWQQIASPIWSSNSTDNDRKLRHLHHAWFDIDQSNTLNARLARGKDDERHMCPLQLDVIDRLCLMYANPGEVCLSPFGGIGSEGVGALKRGLRYVGVELKRSYFELNAKHLAEEEGSAQISLFGA